MSSCPISRTSLGAVDDGTHGPEGFIYNDDIAAVEPAVEEAGAVVALLLTG
jgi:hypothetical protein